MRGPRASGGGRTFADFYYRNVAISEGCGCAEMVIRREQDGVKRDASLGTLLRLLWQRIGNRGESATPGDGS